MVLIELVDDTSLLGSYRILKLFYFLPSGKALFIILLYYEFISLLYNIISLLI